MIASSPPSPAPAPTPAPASDAHRLQRELVLASLLRCPDAPQPRAA